MPFASNHGVNIYYEVYGDGPPMVLVHANPFDRRLFTYQIARFAPYFRLVALDIRGYGRSDKPATPFTLNDMADDVLAVCAQEKIARAIFMGVSVGSGMSLLIGLDRPRDVRRRHPGRRLEQRRRRHRRPRRRLYLGRSARLPALAHPRTGRAGILRHQAWARGCSISFPRTRSSCPANASRRSSAPAKACDMRGRLARHEAADAGHQRRA